MNAFRAWRKTRRKTLEDMSKELGVSMASLSRIERGEQWPPPSVMVKIAEITKGEVTANDLLGGVARADEGAAA